MAQIFVQRLQWSSRKNIFILFVFISFFTCRFLLRSFARLHSFSRCYKKLAKAENAARIAEFTALANVVLRVGWFRHLRRCLLAKSFAKWIFVFLVKTSGSCQIWVNVYVCVCVRVGGAGVKGYVCSEWVLRGLQFVVSTLVCWRWD